MNIEDAFGLPKKEITENQKTLVSRLRELDPGSSDRLIQKIIKSVEMGYADSAKTLCWNEGDKFRNQPEVIKALKTYLFDREENNPWPGKK